MPEDSDAKFYTDCSLCEWDRFCRTERDAKLISVLHVLVKHQDAYADATGNDPEQKLKEYAEALRSFKALL